MVNCSKISQQLVLSFLKKHKKKKTRWLLASSDKPKWIIQVHICHESINCIFQNKTKAKLKLLCPLEGHLSGHLLYVYAWGHFCGTRPDGPPWVHQCINIIIVMWRQSCKKMFDKWKTFMRSPKYNKFHGDPSSRSPDSVWTVCHSQEESKAPNRHQGSFRQSILSVMKAHGNISHWPDNILSVISYYITPPRMFWFFFL